MTLVGMAVTAAALLASSSTAAGGSRVVLLPLLLLVAVGCRVAVYRPRLVLALLVVTTLTHVGDVAAAHGLPRLYLGMQLLALATVVVCSRRGLVRMLASPALAALLVFVVVQAAASFTAADQTAAGRALTDLSTAVASMVLVATLATASGGLLMLARTAVVTAAVMSVLTVAQQFVLGPSVTLGGFTNVTRADLGSATLRHSGPLADPNFWGRDLLLFVPIGMSLVLLATSPAARRRWAVVTASLLVGIYLTGSRGAFIATAVAFVAWAALAHARTRRLLWMAPAALGAFYFVPGVASRLSSLSSLSAASSGAGDPSLVQRVGVLKYGYAMFLDHPILGVGPNNFLRYAAEYERRDGFISDRVLAPHNLYLQMASETGVIGLASWLVFYGGALFVFVRAFVLSRRTADAQGPETALLASGGLAGLVAWAVASVFLHLGEFPVLLTVVAMGIVLDGRAKMFRPPAVQDLAAAQTARAPRRPRRVALVAAMALAAPAAVVAVVPSLLSSSTYHAQLDAVTTPTRGVTGYDFSLATRPGVVATLAAVVQSRVPRHTGGSHVTVAASAQGAVVSVSATGDSAAVSSRLVAATTDAGLSAASAAGLGFALVPSSAAPVVTHEKSVRWSSLAALAMLAATVVALGLSPATARRRGRGSRRRRRDTPAHQPAPLPLGVRTARGMVWAYTSYTVGRFGSLVATAVLAHLLTPSAFGVVAAAVAIIGLLETLSDLGLTQALVIAPATDTAQRAHTVFWSTLTIGFVLSAIVAAMGPAASWFFHEPQLVAILPALAITLFIRAVAGTHYALAQKRLDFRRRTAAEVADVAARAAIGVGFALAGFGAWSLVFGYLAGGIAFNIALWVRAQWRPRLEFHRHFLREMIRFGGALTGVNILAALIANIDYVFVGRVLGPHELGLYTLAFKLPEMLILNISVVASRVLMPAFAGVERSAIADAIRRALFYTMAACLPLACWLSLVATPVLRVVFGEQWVTGAVAMQVLTIYALAIAADTPTGSAYKATGRADVLLKLAIPRAVVAVVLIGFGVSHGIAWVAGAQSVVAGGFALVALVIARRLFGLRVRETARAMWPAVAASAALSVSLILVRAAGVSSLFLLTFGTAIGAVTYLFVLWKLAPTQVLSIVQLLRARRGQSWVDPVLLQQPEAVA
jgi:O-antigen/teichoic acid export membrane protein/O-antigen ligase